MNIYDGKGVGNLMGTKQPVTRCVYKQLQTTPPHVYKAIEFVDDDDDYYDRNI